CGHCDVCDEASARKIQAIEMPSFSAKMAAAGAKLIKKKSKKSEYDQVLTLEQEQRFLALKAWRKMKALELDVPAFVVFGDKSLRDMAIKNPQNIDQLKDIFGVGESKLEKFGWDLLAELGNTVE